MCNGWRYSCSTRQLDRRAAVAAPKRSALNFDEIKSISAGEFDERRDSGGATAGDMPGREE